jgi:hypothetical protein
LPRISLTPKIKDNFVVATLIQIRNEGILSMLKKMIKPVSLFVVFSFLLLDFSVQAANAQMVDTNIVIAVQQEKANRELIAAFLGREDVQQVMIQNGVDAVEAQKRVDSLSNAELTKIANSMEQLPAGGDAVGAVVGAAVFIFVVLLITDLLGLTHVFSFVNAQR